MNPSSHGTELDPRKQRILSAIVSDYISTAEPVGSHVLVERYQLGVRAATVRSEMAEMSELGYLRQPHTSAGRVPSDLGYRFYVSRLMVVEPLAADESTRTEAALESESGEVEAILRRTCALLTGMTRLPAVATPPEAGETEIVRVFVSPVAADKALLVVVLSTGRTENRLLSEMSLDGIRAVALADAFNERYAHLALADAAALDPSREAPPADLLAELGTWRRLVTEMVRIVRAVEAEAPVYVEGTPAALRQPEFRDVGRLSQLLEVLEERSALAELLSTSAADPTRIRIGAEHGRPELNEFSLVATPYYVGMRERGTLGVLGPTRMDYARAMSAVRFMADTVGRLLTRMSVAS